MKNASNANNASNVCNVRNVRNVRENCNVTKNSTQKKTKVTYKRELPKEVLESLEEGQMYQYQIWDGIVKRLATVHPRLLLPVIEEMFQKKYPDKARIEFLSVEYTVDKNPSKGRKVLRSIRADIVIRIAKKDIYHFECQIRPETNMIIRMYEYDTQIVLRYGFGDDGNGPNGLFALPQSVVMYLTHTKNTPDVLKKKFKYPNGTVCEYTVPVMKIQNYTLEKICDKKLYYIIPLLAHRFYNYKNHKCDINKLTEFLEKVKVIIGRAVVDGDLTESEGNDIMGYVYYSAENMTPEEEEEFRRKIFSTVPESLKLPREKVAELETERAESIKNYILLEKSENKTKEECCTKLQKIFSLSEKDAKDKIEKYWQE